MQSGVSRSKNGDFVVQKEVGKGAFARVFRVLRKQDGQVYALKRIRITSMKRKEISDTLGEIRFLASIRHANLIRYYDSFYDEVR
jgi:NIMA (never in mitosis gene a)-related kinase